MTPAVEQALYSLRAVAAESEGDRAKLLRAIASTLESAITEIERLRSELRNAADAATDLQIQVLKLRRAAAPAGEPADEREAFDTWRDEFVTRTGVMPNEADAWRARAAAAAPAGEQAASEALAPLKAANLSAALRAIVRECRGPDKPFSTDSYLPPHLLDLAVAALESTETQEHETPLQVIEAMRRDDIERAPSYEELRERNREKRL